MPPKKGIIPPAETINTVTELEDLFIDIFPKLPIYIRGLLLIVVKGEKKYTITYNNHCCKWSIKIENKSEDSTVFDFAETVDDLIKIISDEK